MSTASVLQLMNAIFVSACQTAQDLNEGFAPNASLLNMAANEGRDAMLDMLRSGKFSDFKIKCGGHTFQVHKNILSARSGSTFWSAAFDGPLRFATNYEYTIKEADPLALATVLTSIYCSGDFSWSDVESSFPILVYEHLKDTASFSGHFSLGAVEEQLMKGSTSLKLGPLTAFQDSHMMVLKVWTQAYELADRFTMPNLKTALMTNIIDRLEDLFWDDKLHPCIPQAIQQIYANTGEMTLLRAQTTALCVAKRGHSALRPGGALEAIVCKADPVGWTVGTVVYERIVSAKTDRRSGELRLASSRSLVRINV